MNDERGPDAAPGRPVAVPPLFWPEPDDEWTQRAAFVARLAHEAGRVPGGRWAKCSWEDLCRLMPEQAGQDIGSAALITGLSRESREEVARFLLSY